MSKLLQIRVFRVLVLVVLCAALGVRLLPQDGEARAAGREQVPKLVWPAPPSQATIRFLNSLPAPETSKNRRESLFRRLGRVLFSRSSEAVVRPLGLAAKNGMLYVTDPGGHAFLLFEPEKNSFHKITKAGSELLVSPVGVAAGKERVFVSDSALKRIFTYDRRGRFLKIFAERELARPTGLALDEGLGRLYVTDTATHQVRIYRLDGTLEKSFGRRGTGDGEFNYPTHLWLDGKGALYVMDALNYRVQIFRPDGAFVARFGHHGDGSGDFASPKGIAADSRGHLYVVDALFDAVQIFDRQGQLLLSFGEQGIGPGQFWLPAGVCIDEKDHIYVADSYNRRIQVFEFSGGANVGE
jgi:DNA-binding beta-propeller fold protein YncE